MGLLTALILTIPVVESVLNESGREKFEALCSENLKLLQKELKLFIERYQPKNFRIYVSLAYDVEFEVVHCTMEEMITDIFNQVVDGFILDSKIYEIM